MARALLLLLLACAGASAQRDPAAWGSNHAGQPVPEYVPGDECLFCHRNDIGPTWQSNTHGATVRQRGGAAESAYVLGRGERTRTLQKDGYGKFAILDRGGKWVRERFGDRCAGCHTTGVETATRTFSAFGLDCYACHGVVDLKHSADTSLVWLSKKRRGHAQAIVSLCGQCHLRGGRSRTSGLPYPDNFVAGDNLFQNFAVDWARADDARLHPGERHVWRNAREVAVEGSEITCLSCHRVHENSSARHRRAPPGAICLDCHYAEGPRKAVRPYEKHSATCEY